MDFCVITVEIVSLLFLSVQREIVGKQGFISFFASGLQGHHKDVFLKRKNSERVM